MSEIALKALRDFLYIVDKNFPVPLSEKVDLDEYAQKLTDKADLIADVSDNGVIQALLAGYINSVDEGMAYIAIVATLPEMRGQGRAEKLVRKFINKCREQNIKGIHLYAVESNAPAVRLYEKLGFEVYKIEDEPRPNDLHLVLWLKECVR